MSLGDLGLGERKGGLKGRGPAAAEDLSLLGGDSGATLDERLYDTTSGLDTERQGIDVKAWRCALSRGC